jgi:hypothetical protein
MYSISWVHAYLYSYAPPSYTNLYTNTYPPDSYANSCASNAYAPPSYTNAYACASNSFSNADHYTHTISSSRIACNRRWMGWD